MRTSESVRYYVGIWCHRTQCPNDTKYNRAPYSCNFNREVVVFLKPFNFFDFVIMVTGNKHANEETFVLLRCQRQLCIVWLPQGRSSFNFVVLNHHLCYVTIPVFVRSAYFQHRHQCWWDTMVVLVFFLSHPHPQTLLMRVTFFTSLSHKLHLPECTFW